MFKKDKTTQKEQESKQEQQNNGQKEVLKCSCFNSKQHIALTEIADFILDAKATKRFIRKVGLWAGIIFAYWTVDNYAELFAWMKTILP